MHLDLALSESEEMLRKTALDFMKRDAPKDVVQKVQETDTGMTPELWNKAVEMGWLGIVTPERYGGFANPLTSAAVLFEALGSGPLPGPYFCSGVLGNLIIMETATEAQKEEVLPAVAEGKEILTLALTEASYGWEPGDIQTTATRRGNSFVLNGVKLFVPEAAAATKYIVAARNGRGATSLFLVDSKASGVSLRRLPGFLMGRSFEIKLDSVKVLASARLGEAEDTWPMLQKAMDKAIPVLCAYKVGGCQALFDMAAEYSRTRVQFGQPIGRFQRVQDMIIEMVNYADAARWVTYECLWKLDTDKPAAESIHAAKAVASDAYWQTATIAHRVFSGLSYAKDHAASFHTRASRSLYHLLGSPSYHRQQLGKLLLGE